MLFVILPIIVDDQLLSQLSICLQPSTMMMLTEVYIKYIMSNISIKQGISPDEHKLAKVIPIYKSDDKQLIQNYKPISVISYFSTTHV